MKEPMPSIELDEVDIKSLTREELANVPYTKWRMYCKVQGCNRFTWLKDYGIWPELYGRFIGGDWINVNHSYFICHGHWKYCKHDDHKVPMKYYQSVDDIERKINYSNDEPENKKGSE